MRQEAFPEFDACTIEHIGLKRQVLKVDVLHAGRGLHFDQVPLVGADWNEDVRAGVSTAERKCGFIQRTAMFERLLGQRQKLVEIVDALADLDAVREELPGQLADLVALVEDGLLLGVRRGDLVFCVVTKPEQFPALAAHQEGGLRDGWCIHPGLLHIRVKTHAHRPRSLLDVFRKYQADDRPGRTAGARKKLPFRRGGFFLTIPNDDHEGVKPFKMKGKL